MAGDKFDPLGDAERSLKDMMKWGRLGYKFVQGRKARQIAEAAEKVYGPEVAEAVENAIKAGKDHERILRQAERDRMAKVSRDDILRAPPPLHGSARWASEQDLQRMLKGAEAYDAPRSILLGTWHDPEAGYQNRHLHWDGDGHLMTVAPTRSGKARTTIIPNLLRYRGSAVVIDPKGELYAATSKWRRENVGPVYRLAPFDSGNDPTTAGFPRHRFDPLAHAHRDADMLALAQLMFPRDPKAPEFFGNDAVTFMQGLMAFVREREGPDTRNLATVIDTAFWSTRDLLDMARDVLVPSGITAAVDAGRTLLDKDPLKGLPNLTDSLRTKLRMCWRDSQLAASMQGNDFSFGELKDRPATIYIEVPFDDMQTFAPWLRVVIKCALDAMVRNRTVPEIPVLFVLDEFLQLESFPEALRAMRTLAGAGVRLWFFLQDQAGLEEHYPDSWKAFFTCAVRQYFGTNDQFTAEMLSRALGQETKAHLNVSSGGNMSAQQGSSPWEAGNSGFSTNTSESVQLVGKPLLAPDEVTAKLAAWCGDGSWRSSILQIAAAGGRPIEAALIDYSKIASCTGRLGPFIAR